MNFTSSLTKSEALKAILYLPVHMLLLPAVLMSLLKKGVIDEPELNFVKYAIGAAYMLVFLGGFYRREFDGFCERPLRTAIMVAGAYMATLFFTALAGMLLQLVPGVNQNNAAVADMAIESRGITAATAIFLAPLVEEPIFRAGVFGQLRKKSRALAYIVGALSFSLYHVVGYAADNPMYLLYAVQYVPASLMLILCYERSNTLWTPVFLHMLINAVSMSMLGGI